MADCLGPERFAFVDNSGAGGTHIGNRERPRQFDVIPLFDTVSRVGYTSGKIAVVGQQQQALAVPVEATDMKQPSAGNGNEVEHSFFGMRISRRTNVTLRLVQHDRDFLFG
jgi:hypothetical protein